MLRVVALTILVGALPFLIPAYAQASASDERRDSLSAKERWLDDYSQPVGFTYGVQMSLNTTYLWRGLYCGALNLQPTANVGYGGLYLDVWGNIGTEDWSFRTFQPEIDLTLGFNRWGLDVHVLYIHNFKHGLFDLNYYDSGRNALELALRYTVSSKLPLSLLWATRFTAADSYVNEANDTIRAYSSYCELSYTHHFRYGMDLYGAIGITPWKSLYTGYQRGFAVQNIEIRLSHERSLSEHIGLRVQTTLSINPSALAADPETVSWHPHSPSKQSINTNASLTLFLKK